MKKDKISGNNKNKEKIRWIAYGLVGVLVLFVIGVSLSNQSIDKSSNLIDNHDDYSVDERKQDEYFELIENDAIKGDKNAPVTIIEWSDYECPFCAKFYSQTYSKIKEQYIDTGKARLIFRDFPLDFHNYAQKAAEAAECAGEQEKYYDMHDILFEKGVQGGIPLFKKYASEIGVDRAQFDKCLDSGRMKQEVKKDMQDGVDEGITGTPGFIINGRVITGAQPFEVFSQAIESALKDANGE